MPISTLNSDKQIALRGRYPSKIINGTNDYWIIWNEDNGGAIGSSELPWPKKLMTIANVPDWLEESAPIPLDSWAKLQPSDQLVVIWPDSPK